MSYVIPGFFSVLSNAAGLWAANKLFPPAPLCFAGSAPSSAGVPAPKEAGLEVLADFAKEALALLRRSAEAGPEVPFHTAYHAVQLPFACWVVSLLGEPVAVVWRGDPARLVMVAKATQLELATPLREPDEDGYVVAQVAR